MAESLLVISVKKAGAGGDDKAKAEPANVNTITIQNWAGSQKPEPEKKEEGQKAPCDAVRDAYKEQAKIRGKLVADYEARREAVAALWLPDPKDKDRPQAPPPKLLTDPADQKTILDALAAQARAIKADEDSLKRAKALAKNFNDLNCKTAVSIDVSQKIVADPTRTVALYLDDNDLSSDKLTIKLDANGLPANISSTADDKSGDVVTGALKSIANVVGFAQVAPDLAGLNSMKSAASIPALAQIGGSQFGAVIPPIKGLTEEKPVTKPKPTPAEIDAKFRDTVRAAVETLLNTAPDTLPALDPPLPDMPLQLLIEQLGDLKAGDGVAETSRKWAFGTIYGAYYYRIGCAPITEKVSFTPSRGSFFRIADEKGSGQPGLTVSGQRSCEVQILKIRNWSPDEAKNPAKRRSINELQVDGDVTTNEADILNRTFFLATDPRMVQVIPISRTSLIARTDGYEFTDGRITSMAYDKPSNALAVVSLPFKATGDIISGFSTAVQGQQSLIKAQSDLITANANQTKAEAEIYNAKAALLKAQTDLLAAQAAADKARKDQAAAQP